MLWQILVLNKVIREETMETPQRSLVNEVVLPAVALALSAAIVTIITYALPSKASSLAIKFAFAYDSSDEKWPDLAQLPVVHRTKRCCCRYPEHRVQPIEALVEEEEEEEGEEEEEEEEEEDEEEVEEEEAEEEEAEEEEEEEEKEAEEGRVEQIFNAIKSC
ncbi:hypothetical protein BC937DRAFT_86174 [Endogone sp. FLAS-F59071]|nr:hypothetical protein BC937DRAFT_86174 [Endogone sp. FLAS-F59071]|eukprot:RUS20216.1 hypothetical protein BC937DRAFT_86174 [Endogone sp. FLAS-F59071]